MIDLHVHSTASDGLIEPGKLPAMAAKIGLTAVALTDHDTVDGVAEFMKRQRRSRR
jgi:predicted metal-dependent phosphoesterase TrpH